jgi:hypothetical protein
MLSWSPSQLWANNRKVKAAGKELDNSNKCSARVAVVVEVRMIYLHITKHLKH